jgi:pantetheine-phosphate adenylyltransferase
VKLTVVSFSGLLINAADAHGANIIIRGVRSVIDYEYEAQMISINRTMNSRIETVLLSASPKTQFISSTIVRQISSMGGDISNFVPKRVEKKFLERQMQKKKGQ